MPSITTTPVATPPATSTGSKTGVDKTTIAGNFNTFLTLLTTQLRHQDPTSPLDTNQFTQQLVQFAQVEQQIKQNDQLSTLVSLDQTAQATTALAYVGATVVVDGSDAQLPEGGKASWSFNASKPSSATITISDSNGQTAFTGQFTVNPGDQVFEWDGTGNDGKHWPPGTYKLTATAVDASGQSVAISTQIQAVVQSVDLSTTPPTLSINGQDFTPDKIKKVILPQLVQPPSSNGGDNGTTGDGSGADSGSNNTNDGSGSSG